MQYTCFPVKFPQSLDEDQNERMKYVNKQPQRLMTAGIALAFSVADSNINYCDIGTTTVILVGSLISAELQTSEANTLFMHHSAVHWHTTPHTQYHHLKLK